MMENTLDRDLSDALAIVRERKARVAEATRRLAEADRRLCDIFIRLAEGCEGDIVDSVQGLCVDEEEEPGRVAGIDTAQWAIEYNWGSHNDGAICVVNSENIELPAIRQNGGV